MREIKFRVWDKRNNCFMSSWVDGCSFGEKVSLARIDYPFSLSSIKSFPDCEIQQFTGLKDKNGVEIYEGDIVKLTRLDKSYSWIAQCIFDVGHAHGRPYTLGFWFIHKDLTFGLLNDFYTEVVGNIMENSELLK